MSRGRDIDDRDIDHASKSRSSGQYPPSPFQNPGRGPDSSRPGIGRGGSSQSAAARRVPDRQRALDRDLPVSKERRRRLTRERSCFVSARDLRTLEEIGRFRAVALDDLASFHFKEDRPLMDRNLQALSDQGLLHCRTVLTSKLEKLRLVTLTVPGKRLLDQERSRNNPLLESRQTIHAGIRKVAEISHDTAIYRMYQAEAAKIRSSGGRVRRVVLDYELKKQVFSPLARARQVSEDCYRQSQETVARENGLRVVDGKIPLPDLRIEYETPDGRLETLDLELATDHYRNSQLREKSRAGFRIYGASRSRGGTVRDERELTRGILSLR